MKIGSVSVEAVIDDWKSDQEYERDVEKDLLRKWANDQARRFITDEQYAHSIALLQVRDYRAELPEDFMWAVQVAYNMHTAPCTRERVVEWTQKVMDGSGCNLRINIECPECHELECSCSSAAITMVDVDRLWAASHPETQTAYMKHFYGFGGSTQRGGHREGPIYGFQLMRPAQNNFFASRLFLGECNSMPLDDRAEYKIQPPNIITNFREGQIMLSYMGIQRDENGWAMIPDHPDAFDAISYAIDAKLARRDYRKKRDSASERYWQNMEMRKDQLTARVRNKLQIPDADEWMAVMSNHFNKLRPYWNSDRNFDRMQPDKYHRPNETYNI